MPKPKVKSNLPAVVPMPGAVVRGKSVVLDLEVLKEAVMTKPLHEVARFHVDVRPVLQEAQRMIDRIVIERMERADQKEIPLVVPETGEEDGRRLVYGKPTSWIISTDGMEQAQEAFAGQGYGAIQEVKDLVQTVRTLRITDEVMKTLGLKEKDLLKLGDNYQETRVLGGRAVAKKALKLGGKGKDLCELAMTQEEGRPRLKVEGSPKVQAGGAGDWDGSK